VDGADRAGCQAVGVTQAIFGLVGVIVGGLLTAGFQVFVMHRDQKRDQRVAARVLDDELAWWLSGLDWAIGHDDLASIDPPGTVQVAWEEHRGALVDLSGDDWATVHVAVRSSTLDATGAPPNTAVPPGLAAGIQQQMDRIEAARGVLAQVTG
jgi:hypothetical protein